MTRQKSCQFKTASKFKASKYIAVVVFDDLIFEQRKNQSFVNNKRMPPTVRTMPKSQAGIRTGMSQKKVDFLIDTVFVEFSSNDKVSYDDRDPRS